MSGVSSSTIYNTNWPIIGHGWAVAQLARSLEHDRVRHAYLITGPSGVGRTAFALAFAQAANCLDPHSRPCGKCRACTLITHGNYADVRIMQAEDGGGRLKIEQVREMQRELSLRPVEARYRIIIMRRFHESLGPAMDALLKTLEEPAPYVKLILTADSVDTLLSTIKSRCQTIPLRTLPTPTVRRALEERYQLDGEKANLLAQLSGGRIGWAIRAATDDTMLSERTELLNVMEQALGESRIGRFALADVLSKDRAKLTNALELWLSYWRDVLLLSHNAMTPLTNRDHRHALQQIAVNVPVEQTLHVIRALKRTSQYLQANVNPRLSVEVLMLDLPRIKLFAAPPT